ncbi:baseplate wedge subunit [Synechococcus phage B3]|jgi:phage baseplate assembly protein W|nr:baseplate wedge subunit [Synechococcus phage B3]QGT54869.1 baseplate wedge subunit [Synechococcus phage B23]
MAIRSSRGFKDISATFQINPLNRDAIAIKNETAISRAVRNLIFTIVGEVPYSDVGSSVNKLLFENMDSLTSSVLESEIQNTLRLEPRIRVIDVKVFPNYENNEFNVTLTYNIVGIDVPAQQLTLALVSAR